MKFVQPKVYLIGETKLLQDNLKEYLQTIDAEQWWSHAPSDGELLIEFAGRNCYQSFGISDKNLNISKVREGNDVYLKNILDTCHFSILEHCYLNFIIANVSKVFTEECCRHRQGISISAESGRYVRRKELHIWIPSILKENHPVAYNFIRGMLKIFDAWIKLSAKEYGLDTANTSFAKKKILTSAIRRLLPIGTSSTMVWGANLRALRHIINLRTSPHAELEMQMVFNEIAKICISRYPNVFQDVNKTPIDGTDGLYHYQFKTA